MGLTLDDDVTLMRHLAGGDDLALNELMSRWKEEVSAFLFQMLGDYATAVDLAQETFIRLYSSRHSYKPSAAFSTYLFHIAANLARSHARWKRRHSTVPLIDEQGELLHEPFDEHLSPAEAAAFKENVLQVKKAVQELPVELREALLLFSIEQMSHAEIAAALNCSAKAVEVRIYRARQTLRERLADMVL